MTTKSIFFFAILLFLSNWIHGQNNCVIYNLITESIADEVTGATINTSDTRSTIQINPQVDYQEDAKKRVPVPYSFYINKKVSTITEGIARNLIGNLIDDSSMFKFMGKSLSKPDIPLCSYNSNLCVSYYDANNLGEIKFFEKNMCPQYRGYDSINVCLINFYNIIFDTHKHKAWTCVKLRLPQGHIAAIGVTLSNKKGIWTITKMKTEKH
jgi:hypothetical protein